MTVAAWRDLEQGAPEVARLGKARLAAAGVAMLGTLRRDSSPRISPVEPYLAGGRLLVGAMTWSGKAGDLRRDARYVLHSVVTGPDSGEGELKLYGSAVVLPQADDRAVPGAWWSSLPAGQATVFALGIDVAIFVEWDTGQGAMTVQRWSARDGYSRSSRAYP
jgi:hypothetical protein